MYKHIGKPVVINFLDHVQDDTKPCLCTAVGILQMVEKCFVVIQTWDCPDEDDKVRMSNSNFFVILKPVIINYTVLKEDKTYKINKL